MKSSAKKVELASVDDLFSTEESRADAQREKVVEIPLSELHPFKGHPFKVKDDEAITEPELQMPMESRSAYMRPPVKNYMKSSWRPGDRWMRSSFTESIRQLPSIVRNGC